MCVTQNRREQHKRWIDLIKKIDQCLAFVHIRSVQDEIERRVSNSVAPSIFFHTNMWIETAGRADSKLILETQLKLLVIQYLMRVG